MEQQQFETLVSRLEETAHKHPRKYLAAVIGVALLGLLILGLVIGFALLSAALLLGLIAVVVLTGGKALIVLAKLGKFIILLVIPAWVMVKSSFKLLFSRFPPPQGRVLKPGEAPALFARLRELCKGLKGPRIHTVLLTDELNAAIVQHPRFGLFGWEKNYLILGFPLLQVLSEQEALAVVAHEYGHLSGHHSRLGGFIYRFRSAWGQLQQLSEQWNDWGSRLIARMFRWYGPYFNAYTFVLARENEYIADQTAVEIAGARNAANALMRVNITSLFEQEEFWPSIERLAANEPEPLPSRSAFWIQSINHILDEGMRARLLDKANGNETNHLDTHPALRDRLQAIGIPVDAAAVNELKPVTQTAAGVWLGQQLDAVKKEFDTHWRDNVAEQWRSRHAYLQERRKRLAELEAKPALNVGEQWERIAVRDELNPETDLLALLNGLLAAAPDHLAARFRRGSWLLAREDEAGISDIDAVMTHDPEAILPGCEVAWRFYQTRDPRKAEYYAQRWRERSEYLARVRAELQTLPVDATLAPADLDEQTLNAIRDVLRTHGKYIRRVYVLRRILKSDANIHDYVLAFETGWFTFGDKGPAVVKRLVQQEFPLRTFIVHLGGEPYKRFRKSIKRLKLAPLEFRR